MNIIYFQFISLEAYNSTLYIQENTLEVYNHFTESVYEGVQDWKFRE